MLSALLKQLPQRGIDAQPSHRRQQFTCSAVRNLISRSVARGVLSNSTASTGKRKWLCQHQILCQLFKMQRRHRSGNPKVVLGLKWKATSGERKVGKFKKIYSKASEAVLLVIAAGSRTSELNGSQDAGRSREEEVWDCGIVVWTWLLRFIS